MREDKFGIDGDGDKLRPDERVPIAEIHGEEIPVVNVVPAEETIELQHEVKVNHAFRDMIILLLLAILVAVGAFAFSRYCLIVYPIKGSSMEHTLQNKDYIMLFRTQKVKYGDIVVFYVPGFSTAEETYFVKRVIGKEGDHMEILWDDNEKCYYVKRNEERLYEPYIAEPMQYYSGFTLDEVVPAGKIFFLGDNRNNSNDSHNKGFYANVTDIEGVGIMKYKSWRDIKIL